MRKAKGPDFRLLGSEAKTSKLQQEEQELQRYPNGAHLVLKAFVWEEDNLERRPLDTGGVHLGKVKVSSPSSQPDPALSYQTQNCEGLQPYQRDPTSTRNSPAWTLAEKHSGYSLPNSIQVSQILVTFG